MTDQIHVQVVFCMEAIIIEMVYIIQCNINNQMGLFLLISTTPPDFTRVNYKNTCTNFRYVGQQFNFIVFEIRRGGRLVQKLFTTKKKKILKKDKLKNHENPNPQRGRVRIHVHMISILLLTVNFRIFGSIFNSNICSQKWWWVGGQLDDNSFFSM